LLLTATEPGQDAAYFGFSSRQTWFGAWRGSKEEGRWAGRLESRDLSRADFRLIRLPSFWLRKEPLRMPVQFTVESPQPEGKSQDEEFVI
jgi:hypothetical protein